MSSKQPIMTGVSAPENSFLPDSASMSTKKQEMDSINFRESLRFFQEQLISAKRTDLPSGNPLKCNIKLDSKRNAIENIIDASNEVKDSEKIAVMYTNSKITPIPTVDTILESVRILRAIQKSQSQRGALWTLDITTSDAEALESYKALEIELQKGFTNVDSLSTLTDETNQLDTSNLSPIDAFLQSDNIHQELNDILTEVNVDVNDNSFVSCPKSEKEDKMLHHLQIQIDTNGSDFAAEQLAKGLTLPMSIHGSIKSKSSETPNYGEFKSQKHNSRASKDLLESDDGLGYSPSDDPEENAEDYLSCCSLSLHDDNNDHKHDLAHGERATSTESDSGMGTDKSVGSLSPVRGEDTEKHLWIESSSPEYASADCSPCESLIRVSEGNVMPICVNNDFDTNGLQSAPLETKLKSDVDHKANIVYENLNNFQECPPHEDISISQPKDSEDKDLQDATSPIVSTNVLQDESSVTIPNELNGETHECDMSRERLVEIIEDKIQQLELPAPDNVGPSNQETNSSVSVVNANGAANLDDNQQLLERQLNKLEDSSDTACPTTNSEYTSACQNTNSAVTREICQNDTGVETPICRDDQGLNYYHEPEIEQDNQASEKAENSEEIAGRSILSSDNEIYVSSLSLECKLTESALELQPETKDNEPMRPKKTVTLSWDPVPLVEHLYDKTQWFLSKDSTENKEYVEEYLNFLPDGVFATNGGKIFSSAEDGCFYFWETEEKQTLLSSLPLQYAIVEASDANTLLLDNRLGRYVKMRFESEDDLIRWKQILQAHSAPVMHHKFLEPVHYPLKSHKKVVIIDLGSCSTRAGVLMDQPTLPSIFFPTVCATDKATGKQLYGMDALLPEVRQNSNLTYPVRPSAKITKLTMDIDALQGLFETIFKKLNVDPKDYALQISIPRSLSTNTQVALMKLLLEELGVKAVSLTRQALLTLYANNTSTAIVVDIGERMDVLPVVDGFILECGVSRLPYGGQRIIHHMKHALAQKHISLSNDVESLVVQYIFENLCYIANNYDDELLIAAKNSETVKKSLPLHPFFKGENILQSVTLDIGRFQVPEGLFNPDLWGLDFPGLHKLVHQAIQTSGLDVRRVMAENIYVSGGVTLIPGFVERLQNEITKLTLPRLKPQIHASPYRYHMAYLGACQLAASDAFPQACITSKEWLNKGLTSLSKWHL